jgi:hypothetical protein
MHFTHEQEASVLMGPTYAASPRLFFHRSPRLVAQLKAVLVHEHVDALALLLASATRTHEELVQAIRERFLLLVRMGQEYITHILRVRGNGQCGVSLVLGLQFCSWLVARVMPLRYG